MLFRSPSKRHWNYNDGSGTLIYFNAKRNFPVTDASLAKEVIIEAETFEVANNVVNLIYAGSLLSYPDISSIKKPDNVIELKATDQKAHKDKFIQMFEYNEHAFIGTVTAVKSWSNDPLIYSLEKYAFSVDLDSFTPHSADPRYGQVFDNYNSSYSYHVRASYAIIAAFSIIEELGLEIRSSEKKRRFIIQDGKEIWNPSIYLDMENRLSKIGLHSNRNFHWIERGDETDVQKEIKPKFGKLIYPNNSMVRDVNIELIEAIHRCSYIRNFITAHKFNIYTQFVSPYDVFNVQSVARVLVLFKLGLWDKMLGNEN